MKVLTFQRPGPIADGGPTRWQSNAPVLSPFGGSLQNATQPEVVAAARQQNPMRALVRLACSGCGHVWQQPSAAGKCPRCHHDDTHKVSEDTCMAQRV